VETGVEEAAAAEKIRNLALLDPALNDEQRVAIQNMSDKQIMEMVAVITKQVEDQDSTENEISDDEIIEEKEATVEEDDWFTQVKDQWTKGKAQREERREARQQRRAERQAQDN
jgi:murein L,D-transpeptidase YafK